MKRLLIVAIGLFMVLILSHCGSVPQTFYYRIDYEPTNTFDGNSEIPATLGIVQFSTDVLYEGDRIVYRQSPYEVKFYNYRRWIAPPRKMITGKILEQYQASNLFQKVVRVPSAQKIDYVLNGEIQAFEEWDEGNKWYGTVAIEFKLLKTETKEIVWQNAIRERNLAEKNEPLSVVKAISQSLEKVVNRSILEIKEHFSNETNN